MLLCMMLYCSVHLFAQASIPLPFNYADSIGQNVCYRVETVQERFLSDIPSHEETMNFHEYTLFAFLQRHAYPSELLAYRQNSTEQKSEAKRSDEWIPAGDFVYAGDMRYTLNGKPARRITSIDPLTASIVGAFYAGAVVGLHINQRNAWWSGERGPLHAQEDWTSALQVDKVGHAFGGYYMSYMIGEFLMGTGFSWETATQLGAGLGFLYQFYVEIEDGYSKAWGFSPSDIYANTAGAMFFLAQHYVPFLQYFTPKWQYTPSQWLGKPQIVRPSTFIDDYNSTTVWLSADVYNLLPKEAQAYWPKWLGIAVGYGGDAIDANPDPNGPPDALSRRRVIVGLDINIVRLLPDGGWFWNWLRQSLNMAVKLPAPAIEFSSTGTRGYLLYPFSISISGVRF